MKNEPKERPSISDIIRSLNEIRNLDCHMGGQVSLSASKSGLKGSVHLHKVISSIYSFYIPNILHLHKLVSRQMANVMGCAAKPPRSSTRHGTNLHKI